MEKINYKEMSNSELKLEQKKLTDKYEVTKTKIIELYKDLEELDKEYVKIEGEIKLRKSIVF